jgi:hypothetical protein
MVGLELVRIVAQWAGTIAVLAFIGCFVAAAAAVELSRAMSDGADDAAQLVRRMALVGGAGVIVAGLTSTLYWWRAGVASAEAAIAMGAGIAIAAVAFAAVVRRLGT